MWSAHLYTPLVRLNKSNLAIGSTNFIGLDQVHYIDNLFNLNVQLISLHVVNIFLIIWYPYSQLHKIDFLNCIILFHKEWYIVYKIFLVRRRCWEALINNRMLEQPNGPNLNTALQTCYALYSCTLTTFGLCYVLQCIVIKNYRRFATACSRLWGIVMKHQGKIDIKSRGFHVSTRERGAIEQRESNKSE